MTEMFSLVSVHNWGPVVMHMVDRDNETICNWTVDVDR